jgi:hypothetical protein
MTGYVLVVDPVGTSNWAMDTLRPPAISSAAAGCADGYCITLTGRFPRCRRRLPNSGQPDVIPNAYSDLSVTATSISLRLNPSVRQILMSWVERMGL